MTKADTTKRSAATSPADGQGLYSGLIRIHILFHACEEGPIFGLGMINELSRHGYRLSAGTLYPLLHGLEKKGLLRSRKVRAGRWFRREYSATAAGRRALRTAKQRVSELFGEIFEVK
jgi:PadR family transcriptional regulator, regulatory protein PadR